MRLALTGPTGVGKTRYVDALLDALPIDVINLDSYQAYAFFRIGPGRTDMRHLARRHLYGYLTPHATLDTDAHVANALAVADELELYGRVPLFEGGSRTLLPTLARATDLHILGLRPPDRTDWREAKLRARVDGYFEGDALIHEVRAALARGYGDTRVMRDPLVYMQTRRHLAGEVSREALEEEIVAGMLAMQDAQLAALEALPVHWFSADETTPADFVTFVRGLLEAQ